MKSLFALMIGCLISLPPGTLANNASVERAVSQSVKGTRIERVALRPVPNSTSIQMTIFTAAGERSLILSQNHIKVALRALNNPRLIGAANVAVARQFINTNPNFKKYISISQVEPAKIPSRAAAVASATVLTANQQASR